MNNAIGGGNIEFTSSKNTKKKKNHELTHQRIKLEKQSTKKTRDI
jgi:hypothetical protein